MAVIEPVSYKMARILLECLCQELAANSIEDDTIPMPQRCCFRAGSEVPLMINVEGQVATDQCCLGEAYVKYIGEYPSTTFPEPDTTIPGPCQLSAMAVTFEMGTIRCLNEEPDCVESSDKMRIMMADEEAMLRAVCCWQKRVKKEIWRGFQWLAGGGESGGPDGGCLTLTMQVQGSRRGPGCC